jgi:nucleotide-binding universal stress UspA family protein
MTFERIVVPTDFSEHADWAIAHAIRLAQASGSRLELVHSYQVPGPYDMVLPDDLAEAVKQAARNRLQARLDSVSAEGVEVAMHLVADSPAQAIAHLATDLGADCIVMGTRGLAGLKHVLLGSNAERTVRLAPCPVLTVGGPVRETARGYLSRILVPMDFSSTSLYGLEVARRLLAENEDGRITLLHVYEVPVAMASYMDDTIEPGFGGLSTRLLKELEALAEPLRATGLECSVRLLEGRSAPVILDVASEEEVDWIVMGTRGRTGLPHAMLGSVADRVIRAAPCPTLSVKDPAQ